MPPVTGIDHRRIDMLAQQLRRARAIMPYHQNMRVHRVQRGGGIKKSLALLDRRSGDIDIQDRSAKILCCQFERHARPCRILEKQVEDGATAKHVRQWRFEPAVILNDVGKTIAAIDETGDLERVQPLDSQKMTGCQPGWRGRCGRHAAGRGGFACALICHESQLIVTVARRRPAEISLFPEQSRESGRGRTAGSSLPPARRA